MNSIRQQRILEANRVRQQWKAADSLRDAGLMPPKGIVSVYDISYGALQQDQTLDLYIPEQTEASYPVIVSIHGGGWFYGDKERYRFYCMDLARRGFAVVNCNYRLAPEHPYPAAIVDVCAVMQFLEDHANMYALDCRRLYMTGDSAGAQLVCQYCAIASNSVYREKYTISTCTLLPKAVGLICGIYDIRTMPDAMYRNWYLTDTPKEPETTALYHCLDYLTESFPPVFLASSVNDPLCICTKPLLNRLNALHIPVEYHEYGQGNTKDGHVFHLNLRSENGQACNDAQCQFFLQYPKERC